MGLLRVEEQQVPIATTTVHRQQYRANRDSLLPIHQLICQLESQGVTTKTRSRFNSPIWPVRKSTGEWRLTIHYRGLNEVAPPLSAAMPDMLELQYQLSQRQPSGTLQLTSLMHSSSPSLWQQSAGHSLLSPGGAFSTPGIDRPRGGNTVPPFAMD